MSAKAIAVDLGGTNIRAALVDANGNVEQFTRVKVQERSPEAIARDVTNLVNTLKGANRELGITMTVPSSVWTATGLVANAPNLGWRDVLFGPVLEKTSGLKVRLVNDLNAITYGEAMVGDGKGERDVSCVFIGTGVGMGAVCNGLLMEGADGLAPEIGHIKYESSVTGRRCGCGQLGCVEAYVGGRHLPDLLHNVHESGTPSLLIERRKSDWQSINAKDIEEAVLEGDKAAQLLWSQIAERCAWLLGTIIMVLNPRVIVLGGGVLQSAPTLARSVDAAVPRYAWGAFLHELKIVQTTLGDNAGIIGAGLSAHHRAR